MSRKEIWFHSFKMMEEFMGQALNNVCPITGGRVDMVTAQDPTAMDMTAMVSMNDMHLHSVSRLMLGLSFSLNLMTLVV